MSKEWGILYHIGGRLRKDKGWSEKESDNPPDKVKGLGLYMIGKSLLVFGKIIEDGTESLLMKKVKKLENM